MKHIYHFLLALAWCALSALSVTAQNIYISDELKVRRDYEHNLLGRIGDKIVFTSHQNSFLNIFLFDKNMALTSVSDKKIDERRSYIQGVFGTEEHIHVVYTAQEQNRLVFMDRVYTPSLGQLSDDTIAIFALNYFLPEIRFSQSENLSKLGIVLSSARSVDKIICYDLLNRSTLIDSDVAITDENSNTRIRKSLTTNGGNVMVIKENNNTRSRSDQHTFEIHTVDKADGKYVSQRISVPEFLTFDADFSYDERLREVSLAGLYGSERANEAEGLFHLSIEPGETTKQATLTRTPLTQKFLTSHFDRKKSSRNAAVDIAFQKVVRTQNGGFLLFFEEESQYARGRYLGTTNRYPTLDPSFDPLNYISTDYHYEDLFVYHINPQGELEWEVAIPKNQYSSDDDGVFSSFFLFQNANHLRILYNDEVKRDNTISEVILLSSGYSRRNTLLSIPSRNMLIQVNNGIQISNDEVIFPARENNQLKLVKFEFLK